MSKSKVPPNEGSSAGQDPIARPAPVVLDALDPTRDVRRFDAIVRAVAATSMAERARQSGARGARQTLDRRWFAPLLVWSRTTLTAAAVVLLAAGVVSLRVQTVQAATPRSLAEAVGIPGALVEWSATRHRPTPAELMDAFESAAQHPLSPVRSAP
jgi:hypothetical protein